MAHNNEKLWNSDYGDSQETKEGLTPYLVRYMRTLGLISMVTMKMDILYGRLTESVSQNLSSWELSQVMRVYRN
jgi:hypothetical protein